jgi:hypothetical protein
MSTLLEKQSVPQNVQKHFEMIKNHYQKYKDNIKNNKNIIVLEDHQNQLEILCNHNKLNEDTLIFGYLPLLQKNTITAIYDDMKNHKTDFIINGVYVYTQNFFMIVKLNELISNDFIKSLEETNRQNNIRF